MIEATQIDLNSIVITVATLSIAANGFFLRGVARRIDTIDERQRLHAERITWLEAHANFPHKRQDDEQTQFHRRANDAIQPA